MEMSIGERVAYVRKHLSGGASTKDFGAAIGVSDSMISQYERGTSTPGCEVLAAICQKYFVSPGWLLLGAGDIRASAKLPFMQVVQDMIDKEQGAHGIFLHF